LLALLPAKDRSRILRHMETGAFRQNKPVFTPGEAVHVVYFPLDSLASVVVDLDGGRVVEVGTIGNEGMTGLPLLLGAAPPSNRAFFQVAGSAMHMTATDFNAEMGRDETFSKVVQLYAQGYYNSVAQSAACNSAHDIEQRLCRWILLTHDRVGASELRLTQEFLAMMLGVRRPSVSVIAAVLKKAGFINYNRGVITVLDRLGIEKRSCACYRIIADDFKRLLCVNLGGKRSSQ
jgi:CRP-like cAMP-binding protein